MRVLDEGQADPSPAGPAPAPALRAEPVDLIGQIKARLLDPSEGGRLWPGGPRIGSRDPRLATPLEPGNVLRWVGSHVIPGSWPSLAATAASAGIPGGGLAKSLLRTGAAATGGAAAEAVRGGDPASGALQGGGQVVGGDLLGAGAKMASRYALSKFDTVGRDLGTVLGRIVPVFKGSTPRQTVNNAMGTAGQIALSKQYGDAVDTAITQAGNPTMVNPLTNEKVNADVLFNLLKSEKRRLFDVRGNPTRTKNVFENLDQVYAAEQEFARFIEQRLPAGVQGLFERANLAYRQGKEIQDLFTGGTGHMTKEKVDEVILPGERFTVNQPELASRLQLRAGKLQDAFSPAEYAPLEWAIQRGSELGARDLAGVKPHLRVHPSGTGVPVRPTMGGFPRAPQRVGKQRLRQ
mgnify:FL=1